MQEHWVSDQVVYRGHAKSMSLRKSGVLPSLLPYHTLSWRHFLAYFYIENEKDDKDQVVRSKIWYSVTWGEGEPNLRFSKWHTFWMAPWVTKVIYRWDHLRAWLPGILSFTQIRDYSFSCVISNRFFAFVPLLTPISLTCYDFQVFSPLRSDHLILYVSTSSSVSRAPGFHVERYLSLKIFLRAIVWCINDDKFFNFLSLQNF